MEIDRSSYHNPPRRNEVAAVQGLRGGASVLMVAAFESFLKQCHEEHLSVLATIPPRVTFSNLPDAMRVTSVYGTLERAMKGPPFQKAPPRSMRLAEIEQAAKLIINGVINPAAFSETRANPNAENVVEMFKAVGINNVFGRVKSDFDRRWNSPTAHSFIADKLNEIVGRRHTVAHTADALSISRSDLTEGIRFLKLLARLLDHEMRHFVESL